MPVRCKHCESVQHTQFYCRLKPRKAIKRTRLKRVGKVTNKWIATRKVWVKNNPPDANGNWHCYLQIAPDCHITVNAETLNVDHIKSRVRRPDLRFDQSNLNAACSPCNKLKGSRDLEEVKGE